MKEFGIIVYGATGYTGRLVCEYLNEQYGVIDEVKWAMAGRSQEKLEQVRDEIGIPAEVRLIVADASDPASIDAMVSRTHVVLTTVGPYQLYGSDLVRACAEASGARIVFSCGFDSVPFDLGVYFLQQAAKQQLSAPVARIKGRVRVMKGTFSGGTLASFKATMAAAMGTQLIERLQQNAGLTFELENS